MKSVFTWIICAFLTLGPVSMHVACGPSSFEKATMQAAESAFDVAVLALEALDAAEVTYLDSLDTPTAADIARAQGHVRLAEGARTSLASAREALLAGDAKGARAKLLEAASAIDTIASELGAVGVKIPAVVHDALAAIRLLERLPVSG